MNSGSSVHILVFISIRRCVLDLLVAQPSSSLLIMFSDISHAHVPTVLGNPKLKNAINISEKHAISIFQVALTNLGESEDIKGQESGKYTEHPSSH